MIEIFGHSNEDNDENSTVMSAKTFVFLNKLFEGIETVVQNENGEISELVSKENEYLQLLKPVNCLK